MGAAMTRAAPRPQQGRRRRMKSDANRITNLQPYEQPCAKSNGEYPWDIRVTERATHRMSRHTIAAQTVLRDGLRRRASILTFCHFYLEIHFVTFQTSFSVAARAVPSSSAPRPVRGTRTEHRRTYLTPERKDSPGTRLSGLVASPSLRCSPTARTPFAFLIRERKSAEVVGVSVGRGSWFHLFVSCLASAEKCPLRQRTRATRRESACCGPLRTAAMLLRR
jgi:hypothetical protein